jgi:hypothetical protein
MCGRRERARANSPSSPSNPSTGSHLCRYRLGLEAKPKNRTINTTKQGIYYRNVLELHW